MPDSSSVSCNNTDKTANTWFVYILACNDGSLYTGITRNISKRVHQHNHCKSGSKYTRSKRPVELVYYEEAICKSSAAKREYAIKKLLPIDKKKLITSNQATSTLLPDINITRVNEITSQLNNEGGETPQIPQQ